MEEDEVIEYEDSLEIDDGAYDEEVDNELSFNN